MIPGFSGARWFLGHDRPWRPTLSMQPPMQCVRRPLETSRSAVAEARTGTQLAAPPPLLLPASERAIVGEVTQWFTRLSRRAMAAAICSYGLQRLRVIKGTNALKTVDVTSTKSPDQRAKVGTRKKIRFPTVSLRVFIGHMTSGSAPRGGLIVSVRYLAPDKNPSGITSAQKQRAKHERCDRPCSDHAESGPWGDGQRAEVGGGLDGQSGSHGGDLFEVTALT